MQEAYTNKLLGEWRAFFHQSESIARIRTEDKKVRYFSRHDSVEFWFLWSKNLNLVAYPFRADLR